MIDRIILDNYYGFNGLSNKSLNKIIEDSKGDIESCISGINNLVNSNIMNILSQCHDDEIITLNTTDDFDDVIGIFKKKYVLQDYEIEILKSRFYTNKKEGEN